MTTAALSAFLGRFHDHDLSKEVRERAVLLITDSVGVGIGAVDLPSTRSLVASVDRLCGGSGGVAVPGRTDTYSAHGAALLTGASIHSLDFDDTLSRALVHPGAPVIGAALAAAQLLDASSDDFLRAVVAGYEVLGRTATSLGPVSHAKRGFHITGTAGVFGASAAAGVLFGLDATQHEHAFGVAICQTAGSAQYLVNGGWSKRYHVGQAAANGLMAATLAAEGFRGASEAYEGKAGLWHLYAEDPQPEALVAGLGEGWELLDVAIKPYPCCRAMHPVLDAAFRLMETERIDPSRLTRVTVGMPEQGLRVCGWPAETKRRPTNPVDCQFSVQVCVSLAMLRGRVTYRDYEGAVTDPELLALVNQVEVEVDRQAEADFPATTPGRLTLTTDDGRTRSCYVQVPTGEPETMLSPEQLRAKFLGLTNPVLGDQSPLAFEGLMDLHRSSRPMSEVAALTVPAVH